MSYFSVRFRFKFVKIKIKYSQFGLWIYGYKGSWDNSMCVMQTNGNKKDLNTNEQHQGFNRALILLRVYEKNVQIQNRDLVPPKMSPTHSFSVMYQKPFIYCRNRTNSQ